MPFFILNALAGVEIGTLILKGDSLITNGVKASGGSGHHLHDLTVSDIGTDEPAIGIHFTSGVTESLIERNVFGNIAAESEWGAAIRLSYGSSGNRILRNTVARTGRGGILADNGSRRLRISGNLVTGSGLGKGGTAPGLGIEIWGGCDSSIIEDNRVDHWLSVDNSDYVAVRRNQVGTGDGTLKFCGLELVGGSHGVLTDNRVFEGSQIGLSVSNNPRKDYVYWAYNSFRTANTWGAQIQGDSGGASFHYFHGNSFLDTPKNHPQALYPGQGHGLRFNGGCFHMHLDSNEFSGNGGGGIQWGGILEGFSLTRNDFSGNGMVAAGVFSGKTLAWEANRATGNGSNVQPAPTIGADSLVIQADFSASSPEGTSMVEFKDRSPVSTPDSGVRRLWDFGDGLPSSERNPSHQFPSKGLWRVTLIVWDGQGKVGRRERMVDVGSTKVAVLQGPEAKARWDFPLPGVRVSAARVFDWGSRFFDSRGKRVSPGDRNSH